MGLCLNRRLGEGFRIGDDIRIEVNHLDSGKVRLHIEAPRELLILRDELAERPGTPAKQQKERS